MSGSAADGPATAPAAGLVQLFDEVARGLQSEPRTLPPKLFYDDRGARLFVEITRLEEYYPTRTELSILERCLPEVATQVGPRARVVEFGSGSGEKTWKLLAALEEPAACIPIDIARDQLLGFARSVQAEHPELRVEPLHADYTRPYRLPWPEPDDGRTLFFFPGSTVGNFEPAEAADFLGNMADAGDGDSLLLMGVDLKKPSAVVEAAYNDPAGVTADFNRNALRNLNALLGADFDPEGFQHRAPWNPEASRIEMHLVSRAGQTVRIPHPAGGEDLEISLAADDVIVTEHSYKYDRERLARLVAAGGWAARQTWTDERGWFAVQLLERG